MTIEMKSALATFCGSRFTFEFMHLKKRLRVKLKNPAKNT